MNKWNISIKWHEPGQRIDEEGDNDNGDDDARQIDGRYLVDLGIWRPMQISMGTITDHTEIRSASLELVRQSRCIAGTVAAKLAVTQYCNSPKLRIITQNPPESLKLIGNRPNLLTISIFLSSNYSTEFLKNIDGKKKFFYLGTTIEHFREMISRNFQILCKYTNRKKSVCACVDRRMIAWERVREELGSARFLYRWLGLLNSAAS